MTGTRKRYPASFRARVALEAAKQTRTLAELSGRYHVHSVPISQWKKHLLDGIESLFRDHDESQAIQAELYEQIGRLKMELEWLKKKLPASIELKRPMIEKPNSHLSMCRQRPTPRSPRPSAAGGSPRSMCGLARRVGQLVQEFCGNDAVSRTQAHALKRFVNRKREHCRSILYKICRNSGIYC